MLTHSERVVVAASAAHEVNRIFAIVNGERQPHWEDASNAVRTSALMGVDSVLDGQTGEQLHESWKAARVADGWVYGPVKDEAAKTHPCIVPYNELPEFQRRKDYLFNAVVTAVLQALR